MRMRIFIHMCAHICICMHNIWICVTITQITICTFEKVKRRRLHGFEIQIFLSLARYFLHFSILAFFPINISVLLKPACSSVPVNPCTYLLDICLGQTFHLEYPPLRKKCNDLPKSYPFFKKSSSASLRLSDYS